MIAKALSYFVKRDNYDIVLLGKQGIDYKII
jgi:electron transfer flavoprotein alpha/beta subunit